MGNKTGQGGGQRGVREQSVYQLERSQWFHFAMPTNQLNACRHVTRVTLCISNDSPSLCCNSSTGQRLLQDWTRTRALECSPCCDYLRQKPPHKLTVLCARCGETDGASQIKTHTHTQSNLYVRFVIRYPLSAFCFFPLRQSEISH